MEEFEKYWEKLEASPSRDLEYFATTKEVGEAVWEAALGWVREKLNCEIQPGDIAYFIDKELE